MYSISLMIPLKWNRMPAKYIYYALPLYISGLIKKDISAVVSICQEESYFHLELESIMVQAEEDVTTEEKKSTRVHNRRNIA